MTKLILGFFCLLLVGMASDTLAEPSMGVHLSHPQIAIGDTTYINVIIGDVANPPQPSIEVEKGDANGVSTELVSTRAQHARRGNSVTMATNYRFAVTGVKSGELTLTAIVNIDGENLASDPVELSIREQTDAEKALIPTFAIRAAKDEIFIGEMLPLNLVISSNRNTRLQQFLNSSPEVESDGFVMQPVSALSAATEPDANGNDLYFFTTSCEALRPGMLTLGPARYTIQLGVPTRGFGRYQTKRIEMESPKLQIKVKPLPEAGKPESFSGSVGQFELNITASPRRLKQGEPISVTLAVSGTGNLPSIDAPDLTGSTDNWKFYDTQRFDSRNANRDPRVPLSNTGRVTFVQMIVPVEPLTEIPPYEFSFFDPDTGTYQTLRTDPIPIEVEEAEQKASVATSPTTSAPGSDPKPEPPPRASTPVEEMTDILSIRDVGNEKWLGTTKPLMQSKLFWALQAPPAAALLAFVFIAAGRRINENKAAPVTQGIYPSCAEILSKIERKPKDSREFYELAHQFVEAWQEQAGPDSANQLDSERRQAIQEISNRHSFLSFGSPANGESEKMVETDERNNVIRTLKSLPGHA